jgi:hypothetical protein
MIHHKNQSFRRNSGYVRYDIFVEKKNASAQMLLGNGGGRRGENTSF